MPIHVISQYNSKYSVLLTKEVDATVVLSNMEKELGTMWTIRNSPHRVKNSYPDMDEWDIEDMVLLAMSKYGVENVRGGSYKNEKLSHDEITIAERNVKVIKTKYANKIQKVVRGYMVRKQINK
jgi:hypothetical protein